MTSFEEEKAMVRFGLFIAYREIRARVTKGFRFTYGVVNYTSPAHSRETSENLTSHVYPIRNRRAGK
jgi:hypothetical protein